MARFEDSLSIADEMEAEINEEARLTAFKMLSRLMIASPVGNPDLWQSAPPPGYAGGQFRGNWFVFIGDAERKVDDNRRQSIAESEGEAVIKSAIKTRYPTITLTNNQPYGERLNDGHSTQAPKKFIEKEVDRVSRS